MGWASVRSKMKHLGKRELTKLCLGQCCCVARAANVIRRYFGAEMGVPSPENNPFLRQVSSDFRELFRSDPAYPTSPEFDLVRFGGIV